MLEKNPAIILLGVSLFLLNTFFPAVIAQIRSGGEVVVIEGATIIDGTGSGPQKGWIIVLGDGRIQDVGPVNQVRRPFWSRSLTGFFERDRIGPKINPVRVYSRKDTACLRRILRPFCLGFLFSS